MVEWWRVEEVESELAAGWRGRVVVVGAAAEGDVMEDVKAPSSILGCLPRAARGLALREDSKQRRVLIRLTRHLSHMWFTSVRRMHTHMRDGCGWTSNFEQLQFRE